MTNFQVVLTHHEVLRWCVGQNKRFYTLLVQEQQIATACEGRYVRELAGPGNVWLAESGEKPRFVQHSHSDQMLTLMFLQTLILTLTRHWLHDLKITCLWRYFYVWRWRWSGVKTGKPVTTVVEQGGSVDQNWYLKPQNTIFSEA